MRILLAGADGASAAAQLPHPTYPAPMNLRAVDPRDTAWEQDHGRYRVYFWDVANVTAHEYEILDHPDADEVLTWATNHAAAKGWTFTLYLLTTDDRDLPGLIRLAGTLGDPFANAPGTTVEPRTAVLRTQPSPPH